jgi:hypothetical protein
MPGPVAGYVSKGSFMRKLDLTLNVHGTREKFLDRFKAKNADGTWTETVLDITMEMLPLDGDERQHIARHWFDPYRSWWPKQQPVDIIVRLGMIQAIELADQPGPDGRPRRIDCYWMNGVEDVRLTACVSPAQVTVILFTPAIPFSDHLPENFAGSTEREPIYTVRHRSRGPGEHLVSLDQEFCEMVQPLVPREMA